MLAVDFNRASAKPLGQINTVLVPGGTVALWVIGVLVPLTEEDNGHLEKPRVGNRGGEREQIGAMLDLGAVLCCIIT